MITYRLIILIFFTGILLNSWPNAAHGQGVAPHSKLILSDEGDEYRLGTYLELLEDPTTSLTLTEVQSAKYSPKFIRSLETVPNLSFTDSAYWVRFQVENRSSSIENWLLEISYPLLDDIQLYLPDPACPNLAHCNYSKKRTGNLQPLSSRDRWHHNFIFDLPLPTGSEQIIYLRFQSEASLTLPMSLKRVDSFYQTDYRRQFLFGIFYGVLFFSFGYNFFLYVSLREPNYLYYLLFIGLFVPFRAWGQGVGQLFLGYVFEGASSWNREILLILVSLVAVFSLKFTSTFLQTKIRTPKTHWVIRGGLVLYILSIFLIPFMRYGDLIRLQLLFLLPCIFIIFFAGMRGWQKGYRPARYFLLAWLILLLGTLSFVFVRFEILPSNDLTEDAGSIGVTFLVLLLSIALADNINVIKEEKAAAFEEVRAINEQLEERVQHRTAELSTSNAELLKAKEESEQAMKKAEVANEAKSQFLATMSHELRTPLNGILGYAQILKRDSTVTAHQTEKLTIIEQSGNHLLNLIDDVLDLAKIEANRIELYTTKFLLIDFLQNLSKIFQLRAEQKKLTFHIETDPPSDYNGSHYPLPKGIEADEKRLRQILINLLSNAIKFTDAGHVTLRVWAVKAISPTTDPLPSNGVSTVQLQFQVEDSGSGISDDELEMIFEPFEQVGNLEQRSAGTGLGLSISRRLLRLMGSELHVDSKLGQGSKFYFDLMLPLAENWLTDDAPSTTADSMNKTPQPIIFPPSEKLSQLYQLAITGDVEAVQLQAGQLAELDPNLAPFAAEIELFCKTFQIEKMCDWLEVQRP